MRIRHRIGATKIILYRNMFVYILHVMLCVLLPLLYVGTTTTVKAANTHDTFLGLNLLNGFQCEKSRSDPQLLLSNEAIRVCLVAAKTESRCVSSIGASVMGTAVPISIIMLVLSTQKYTDANITATSK